MLLYKLQILNKIRCSSVYIKALNKRENWLETHQSSKQESHYTDATMSAIASQITSLTIVYSTVYSDADQRKHQSSASLVFVWGIQRGPVKSPHKWPVTRKMFPFDDVIMIWDLIITFLGRVTRLCFTSLSTSLVWIMAGYTVKPVYNDHLMGYFSAFWSSSRWPRDEL